MTTHFDEEDEGREADLTLDDPLTVILRPSSEYLGPPAGRYEAIRRGANRRRLLRAALGAGATCAVIVLAALPFRPADHDAPTTPTVPLAPPPASSSPTTPPSPSATRAPSPTASTGSHDNSRYPSRTPVPTAEPSRAPTTSASASASASAPGSEPASPSSTAHSVEPSAVQTHSQ